MKVSEFQNLEYRVEDRVAYLRLNRPEALNSFSSRLYGEVKWAFRHVSHDDNVDMAVITGTGRSFATGGDLKETLAPPQRQGRSAVHVRVLRPDSLVLAP